LPALWRVFEKIFGGCACATLEAKKKRQRQKQRRQQQQQHQLRQQQQLWLCHHNAAVPPPPHPSSGGMVYLCLSLCTCICVSSTRFSVPVRFLLFCLLNIKTGFLYICSSSNKPSVILIFRQDVALCRCLPLSPFLSASFYFFVFVFVFVFLYFFGRDFDRLSR